MLRSGFILLILFCFRIVGSFAQGNISGPPTFCLGDLSNFSYSPPSGLTVSSITWAFGDGITTSSVSPSHTYANKGKFKVSIQATLSNSSIAIDTFDTEVFGLPKAHFYYIPSSDTCFNDNRVCYMDTSSPAVPGQTITFRLFVWGDGTFVNQFNPSKNDTLCHNYSVASGYNLRMEITDKYGCKNSVADQVNIVENITAKLQVKTSFIDCQKAQVCIRNQSFGTPASRSHYRLYVDTSALDTGLYLNNSKCVPYSASRSGKVTLIAYANNNCRDTITVPFNIVINALPTEMFLLDTVKCATATGQQEASVNPAAMDSLCWYRENIPPFPTVKGFTYFSATDNLPLGTHEYKIKMFRGSCIETLTRKMVIIGPRASITAIDNVQCFSNRKVYFVDNSKGVKKENCKYNWAVNDSFGDNCVAYHAKGVNLYSNCNSSRDNYFKHRFKNLNSIYYIGMRITDTVTGCTDTTTSLVYKLCSPILVPDTHHICDNQMFKENSLSPYPDSFSVDSGYTWRVFPSYLKGYPPGIYDLGFKFKKVLSPWAEDFGNDSLIVHPDTVTYWDTVFRQQRLWIHSFKTDSAYVKIYGKCKPYRVSVHFVKGVFKKGEKLTVAWSDTGNFDEQFTSDTTIDSIMHYYNYSGLNHQVGIYFESDFGCQSAFRYAVERGKSLSKYTPKFINCIKDSICFTPFVYDLDKKTFWTGNTPNNKVSWYFPGDNQKINSYNPCYRFKADGMQGIEMIVADSLGCNDTLRDSIFVQNPRANLRRNGFLLYCSELKQFFDSSSHIKNPKHRRFLLTPPYLYIDSVKRYSWKFGDGVYNSFQKNPLQSINTSLDSIRASHAIELVSGCTDTIHFSIKVIGPKPYFSIRDTIGCGSLEATFINQSRNSKHYIWQFGDSLKTSFQTSGKQDVKFNYTKPGRYHISLIGIDTVYNAYTNQLQACFTSFPDKLFQKDSIRTVLVLPHNKTGIISPDTVCTGSPVLFSSLSDTAYQFDHWDMGDSSVYDTTAPSFISHTYFKTGNFKIKVNPSYTNSLYNQCLDSAEKTVVVLGVEAKFDVDPGSFAPLFIFNNQSKPITANFNWDFGQQGSADNTSTEVNTSKDYGTDTGTYNVCLIASIEYGCADTICKTVFNDHLNEFGIYNVFTPGKIDQLNDQYDIQIEGETLYDLKIYNRWGQLVFEGQEDPDKEGNWNGKHLNKGEDCPAGTYYYIFRYSLRNKPDEVKTIEGVIHLIR